MMKKFSSYFHMAALAAVVCLSGCGNDEEDPKPAPTVKFVPGETTVTPAAGTEVYEVSVSYHADEKIKSISVFVSDGTDKENYDDVLTKDFNSTTDHTVIYELDVPTSGYFEYEFQIVDKNEKTVSKKLKINASTAAATEISQYTATLLGNNKNSTQGSFFSSSNGQVYLTTPAKNSSNLIDLVHYFGANNKATMAAPSNLDAQVMFTDIKNWATKNATSLNLTTLNATQFDAITKDDITASAGNPTGTDVKNLAVGNVVAFKTATGKLGLFKVTNLTGSATESGAITIDVKVQK